MGEAVSKLNMHLARQSKRPLNTLVELSFVAPGRRHLFKDTIIESSPSTFDHVLDVDLSSDYKLHLVSTVKNQPRPELLADISISGVRKIKVAAFVNPDVTDFSSSAKVEYGIDEYSVGSSWKMTKLRSTLTTRAKLDIVYPKRTIMAKADMTSSRRATQTEVEIQWDAKKDAAKRFLLKTDTLTDSRNPTVNIRGEWYDSK